MNLDFYPSIEPFKSYMLNVDDTHSIYVEECGNPNGEPIVFLHGGPGGGSGRKARRLFDPEYYHIILFDQRGCGRSKPFLSLKNNTIFHLVEDMEKIRKHIGIDRWLLFGGSFGSSLALTYSFHYPERVKKMILQGICLLNKSDLHWFFQEGGLSEIYPDEFKKFKDFIPKEEQNNMLEAYYKRIHLSNDEELKKKACKIWCDYELRVMESEMAPITPEILPHDLSLGVIETHYFYNWNDSDYILNNVHKIKDIPCSIAHGRLDFNCRLYGAFKLAEKLKNCELEVVEGAGHSPFTDKMSKVLIRFLEEYKEKNKR